jgi:hydrogenase expression/formation protein HypC
MCIAAPAQILEINDNVATVDFGGVRQQAKLDLVGDAIEVLTDQEAKESLEAWDELFKALDEEE